MSVQTLNFPPAPITIHIYVYFIYKQKPNNVGNNLIWIDSRTEWKCIGKSENCQDMPIWKAIMLASWKYCYVFMLLSSCFSILVLHNAMLIYLLKTSESGNEKHSFDRANGKCTQLNSVKCLLVDTVQLNQNWKLVGNNMFIKLFTMCKQILKENSWNDFAVVDHFRYLVYVVSIFLFFRRWRGDPGNG